MLRVVYLMMGLLFFSQEGCAQACVKPWCYEQPDAFEKTYVCPQSLLYSCEGTFFLNEDGYREKVRAVLQDCKGTYVIRIWTQCPYCGTCYRGKHPPEGMSCPIIAE